MVADPLTRHALDLLARGHSLYAGARAEPAPVATRDLPTGAGRPADAARRATEADAELARLLGAAHADHELGRQCTRAVLDDAHADPAPAADTAIGQRETARRMANRLRTQRAHIHRSRRRAGRLGRRMRRLDYPAGRVTAHIAAALDRLGITDPAARRNWVRGYQTLIARESGGWASAIASEPAGHGPGYARGLTQTIPATFARYHQPGTSIDIYDPVANICASINYVMRRYGVGRDGADLAARVQQADPHRTPKGY